MKIWKLERKPSKYIQNLAINRWKENKQQESQLTKKEGKR